jgi:hypothetical protein
VLRIRERVFEHLEAAEGHDPVPVCKGDKVGRIPVAGEEIAQIGFAVVLLLGDHDLVQLYAVFQFLPRDRLRPVLPLTQRRICDDDGVQQGLLNSHCAGAGRFERHQLRGPGTPAVEGHLDLPVEP